jgi:hypothetical protein
MPPTNRRPRTVETSQRCCPHGGCRYRGWLGRGNRRAGSVSKVEMAIFTLAVQRQSG